VYVKLFDKILDSSIWLESDAIRIAWITILAAMDFDGFVQFASSKNLALRANIPIDAANQAIAVFERPDPDSSDPEHEGRRIERVDGGWMVLNAKKYRDAAKAEHLREQVRERVKKFRDMKRKATLGNGDVTLRNENVTPTEEEEEVDKEQSIVEASLLPTPPSGGKANGHDKEATAIVQRVFSYYVEKTQKNKAYVLTPGRLRKGISRFNELMQMVGGDPAKAEESMCLVVDAVVNSDWHMGRDPKTGGRKYNEWENHLFNSQDRVTTWLQKI
jgi:hypothetical protein